LEWLVNHDRERGAWTNEDGNWRYNFSGRSFSGMSTALACKRDWLKASYIALATAAIGFETAEGLIASAPATLMPVKPEEQAKVK
jgi:hypothetical protein